MFLSCLFPYVPFIEQVWMKRVEKAANVLKERFEEEKHCLEQELLSLNTEVATIEASLRIHSVIVKKYAEINTLMKDRVALMSTVYEEMSVIQKREAEMERLRSMRDDTPEESDAYEGYTRAMEKTCSDYARRLRNLGKNEFSMAMTRTYDINIHGVISVLYTISMYGPTCVKISKTQMEILVRNRRKTLSRIQQDIKKIDIVEGSLFNVEQMIRTRRFGMVLKKYADQSNSLSDDIDSSKDTTVDMEVSEIKAQEINDAYENVTKSREERLLDGVDLDRELEEYLKEDTSGAQSLSDILSTATPYATLKARDAHRVYDEEDDDGIEKQPAYHVGGTDVEENTTLAAAYVSSSPKTRPKKEKKKEGYNIQQILYA
jgi:hypothetical protein